MKPFRFSLEQVLSWRRTEFDLARAELERRAGAVAALDRARAEVEAAGIAAELQVRQYGALDGLDLAALAGFRSHVRATEARIAAEKAQAERRLVEQRGETLAARRRTRLLERLRERRLQAWTAAAAKEIEDAAAESHLARFHGRG
jgi:hypothetical protein